MRTIVLATLVIAGLGITPSPRVSAQSPPRAVELPGTQLHPFRASDGEAYDLYVALPFGYQAESGASYPVLYLTDARLNFLGTAQTLYNLVGGRLVEPLILVGIDRPFSGPFDDGDSWTQWAAERTWSLTPSRDPEEERSASQAYGREVRSGGAQDFFEVLNDEIIPWVEEHFRTSDVRGLGGTSFGGLFASWVLFTAPETFDRYLIGSPSLDWDKRMLFGLEETYSRQFDDLTARVFLSAGTEEGGTMLSDMLTLAQTLDGRDYPRLELKYDILTEETHRSAIPSTLTRGLRYLFPGS